MKLPLQFIDIFSGGGGFSHGLISAGWECLAHAELDPYSSQVLHNRWPNIPNLGDVTKLYSLPDAPLIVGGSPCQDLSRANRTREGLAGKRSGLFYTQVDLWRNHNSNLMLWENVKGALNSNGGNDFCKILSELLGAKVSNVRWGNSGLAFGPSGSVCWRVLDSRLFGIPQERKRIFLLADKLGRDTSSVLFDSEMVKGDVEGRGKFSSSIARLSGRDDSGLVYCRARRSTWSQRNYIGTLTAHESKDTHWMVKRRGLGVRKLTEGECESLMTWPKDSTTGIPWQQRYKVLGNGVVSLVAERIGERLKAWMIK